MRWPSSVWDPYGITLLSNYHGTTKPKKAVWDPYGITLLSNNPWCVPPWLAVWDPYGITLLSNSWETVKSALKFETPMELHCSQTNPAACATSPGLRPLWNYTALKHNRHNNYCDWSLRPLWNYTALKPLGGRWAARSVWDPYGITLLSNLIRIKFKFPSVWDPYGITLLSNNGLHDCNYFLVWDPYGITLLSNRRR